MVPLFSKTELVMMVAIFLLSRLVVVQMTDGLGRFLLDVASWAIAAFFIGALFWKFVNVGT